ncbi:MAG: sugar phosphate isomerase/epimerase family protein [Isosphaeraceae bacterium]
MNPPRIRIGNQTNCHVPARQPYAFALGHGFDAFEWFSDPGRHGWSEDDFDASQRRQLSEEAAARGLLFSVHAPIAANPVTPEGAAAIRRSIAFAGDVNAGVVNIHLFLDASRTAFAESLGPLLEASRAAGTRLSLENTPETSPEDFNAVFEALSSMPEAAGRVGMCFDMGHANIHHGTRHDYLGYLDRLDPRVPVIHWHAHENWGDRDSHLTLFTGPSRHNDQGVRGIVRRLIDRSFSGSVVLEQWPDPPELLVQARDRLRQLIASVASESARA